MKRLPIYFLLTALFCLPAAASRLQCTATWQDLGQRFRGARIPIGVDDPTLLFSHLPAPVIAQLGSRLTPSDVNGFLPGYILRLVGKVPDMTEPEIVDQAEKLPTDPESLAHQEVDYWQLRYKHFWGGGLQHPRDVKKLAALEIRAARIRALTGKEIGNQAREDQIYRNQGALLLNGALAERLEAVVQLAELGDDRSLDLLARACRDDKKLAVRAQARLALLAHGRAVDYDKQMLADVRRGRLKAIEDEYNLAHEELSRMPDAALRDILADSYLQILNNGRAQDLFFNRDLSFVIEHLASPDPWIRGIAVRGLRGRYEDAVLPLLERMLADPNAFVATEAVQALAVRRDPASRALLARTAKTSKFGLVRDIAEESLGRLGGPDPEHYLSDAALSERLAGYGRDEAIQAATDLTWRPTAVVAVALRSKHAEVRLSAVKALTGRQDPATLALLKEAFDPKHEPVADVRVAALEALFRIKSRESDAIIAASFRDENERVRQYAVERAQGDDVLRALNNKPLQQAKAITDVSRLRLGRFRDADVRADHQATLYAAEHVYEVAEAGLGKKGDDLVEGHQRFLSGVPLGQRVLAAEADPRTGLKYYYSEPMPGFTDQPRIVSFAGTKGMMDVLADLGMGRPQVTSPFFVRLKERLLKDLLAGEDIDITGHSLGGVPASVMAYDLHAATRGVAGAGKVRLVTWNGLGARDYIERRPGFDPAVAASLDATNYHVPGDIVWRIANRLGVDVSLPGEGVFRPITSHKMSAVADRVEAQAGLQKATPAPKEFRASVAPALAEQLGWLSTAMQKMYYRLTEMQRLRSLLDARVAWAREKGYEDLDPSFDPWLQEVEAYRADFRTRDYKKGLDLIDSYEALRAQIVAIKRMRRDAAPHEEIRDEFE